MWTDRDLYAYQPGDEQKYKNIDKKERNLPMKQYTFFGTHFEGETYVGWAEGKNVDDALRNLIKQHRNEGSGEPMEIIAAIEGHLTDKLAEIHDGCYPLNVEQWEELNKKAKTP